MKKIENAEVATLTKKSMLVVGGCRPAEPSARTPTTAKNKRNNFAFI